MSDTQQENDPNKQSLEQRLLRQRTISIFGEIDQEIAQSVTERLIVLAAESDDDILIYLNSPGGHVESGDTIFDMIRFVKPRVKIIGTGWVASAGALIFAAPPKESRFCLPNTRFLLHQPSGGMGGAASDVKIEVEELLKMRQRLNQTFARQTGQPVERIARDSDRNFWMSAEAAIEYGLVGRIVASLDEVRAA